MLEHAAAAAGGSVGGVAGKKVSDSLNKVLNKVDATTKAAAKGTDTKDAAADRNTPLLQVGPGAPKPGTPKRDESGVVPPPPPARRASVQSPPDPPPAPVVKEKPAPPPPPKEVSLEELKTLAAGMKRDDVLKLGPPSARITMFDDGHLLEIFRYMSGDNTLGVVRLTDGAISSLNIR